MKEIRLSSSKACVMSTPSRPIASASPAKPKREQTTTRPYRSSSSRRPPYPITMDSDSDTPPPPPQEASRSPSAPPPGPPPPGPPPPPPPPGGPHFHTGSPTDFLKNVVGKRVIVRLTSGVDYRGVLSCLDGYMNIAMEQTEEFVNDVKTNKYGDAFIRGNNVLYISAAETL
ncbi:Sm-like ribonucleo protein [Pluteus cervinus]|uniref:Sm-like ribonucleo protein n=1 Tax=Pluteus cervinus TaxID=181527 RepID=A0ACD3A7Q4_9AGAR|nr:Sm-like ribonucleo protein [Pluteus cervinus]